MHKLKETMRPKLLAYPPESKAWSEPQNLSKDKQLFEAKCFALSEEVGQRYHLHEHLRGDGMLSVRDADMGHKLAAVTNEVAFSQILYRRD